MTKIDEFNKDCGGSELKGRGTELDTFIFMASYLLIIHSPPHKHHSINLIIFFITFTTT